MFSSGGSALLRLYTGGSTQIRTDTTGNVKSFDPAAFSRMAPGEASVFVMLTASDACRSGRKSKLTYKRKVAVI